MGGPAAAPAAYGMRAPPPGPPAAAALLLGAKEGLYEAETGVGWGGVGGNHKSRASMSTSCKYDTSTFTLSVYM